MARAGSAIVDVLVVIVGPGPQWLDRLRGRDALEVV
jgi:hypothetical protein